jgi:general secretion pathway protein D
MKTKILALALVLVGLELWAQPAPGLPGLPAGAAPRRQPMRFGGTNGSVTQPRYSVRPPAATNAAPAVASPTAVPEEMVPAGTINFQSADVNQVLDIYSDLVGRTLLRPATLAGGQIVLKTKTPLTKSELIQALQAVLAMNGVSLVNIGDKFVKVLPSEQAGQAGGEVNTNSAKDLPNLGSYLTHIEQLKYVKPSVMIPLITPFAKLANGLTALDENGILVMRDYAENIKRMLEMIARIDVSVPAEYISEVIPIRYAEANDIASALNSLGGSGGSTVSFGNSGSSTPISGMGGGGRTGGLMGGMNSGGMGGMGGGGGYQSGGMGGGMGGSTGAFGSRTGMGTTGATGANGTPTGGSTFQQRLASIVGRAGGAGGGGAGGADAIQVFGQTKIIADQRSNSLLVFATRQDMENIKHVISQLDVLLSQVLIEAIIMDVTIGNSFNFGVSVAQNKTRLAGSDANPINGAGGMNNGQPFANFLRGATAATNLFPGNTTGTLPSDHNFSYFGSIGPSWDVAVQAAESDSHASIIQRPRIQTSQAKPAQFFVGETKPYVTQTYNNSYSGGYGGSSYSQLSVGVELDVTPFINPDGLVVMDIQQEIDDFNGTTTIAGVGDVPNTIKRTLNTEIAVKDRDTVMLGGFIKSDKANSKQGVPLLQDIPWLGNLFSSRSDSKDRKELIVLMRPTVLKTPEIAAQNSIKEARRLPGVSAAAADDADYERGLIAAERKKELKSAKHGNSFGGFFNMPIPEDTNAPAATAPAPANPDDAARAALEQKLKELDTQDATQPATQPNVLPSPQ